MPTVLAMARRQGAEYVDFDAEDPVETILEMTGGIGVDRAIDAVGVDAEHAHAGSPAQPSKEEAREFREEAHRVAPAGKGAKKGQNGGWKPSDAPSQVPRWAVEALAKAGTLSIIGVYSETMNMFPIGQAMEKNLTIKMGNCNHRRHAPHLIELVRAGAIDPTSILSKVVDMEKVPDAYRHFDRRDTGWTKVELKA